MDARYLFISILLFSFQIVEIMDYVFRSLTCFRPPGESEGPVLGLKCLIL